MGIYNNTDSRTPKRKKQIKGGFMKGREISRKVGTNKGAQKKSVSVTLCVFEREKEREMGNEM